MKTTSHWCCEKARHEEVEVMLNVKRPLARSCSFAKAAGTDGNAIGPMHHYQIRFAWRAVIRDLELTYITTCISPEVAACSGLNLEIKREIEYNIADGLKF